MDSLVKKLKLLKSLVTKWERKKKSKAREEFIMIEFDLDNFYTNYPGGLEKEIDKVIVLELERRKLVLLRQEEETWRQKRRINWLASGDRNTKNFHAYANSKKQKNIIWEINKEDGSVISSNQDLQVEVVGYFQTIYKAQPNICIFD